MTKRKDSAPADQPELEPQPETTDDTRDFAEGEDEETEARAERLEQLLEPKAEAPIVPAQETQAERDARTRTAGQEWSPEQVAIMKRTIARDLTDDEYRLFLAVARRLRLDPLQRQIYAIKRRDRRAGVDAQGNARKVMTIQTGIDGYRTIADRTGRYAPGREAEFELDAQGKLYAARAYCMKQTKDGTWHEAVGVAFFDEYVPKDTTGTLWPKMPKGQLAKCAEALALRRAFPGRFGDVKVDAEMDQANDLPLDPRQAVEPATRTLPAREARREPAAQEKPVETVKRVNGDEPKEANAGMIGAIRRLAIDAGVWDKDAANVVLDPEFAGSLGIADPGPFTPNYLAAQMNAAEIAAALRALAVEKKVEAGNAEA